MSTFASTSGPSRFEISGGLTPDDPRFVFSLPEYSEAFGEVFRDGLDRLCEDKSPVIRELVRTERGQRVRTQRITIANDNFIDIEPQRAALPFRFTANDILTFDLNAFARSCDEAAETLTDSKLRHIIQATDRVAEALGQVGSAAGRPFGWSILLEGLGLVEIDFDQQGNPILPRIVAENDLRHFVEYPPMTDEHRPAFEQLVARKREEFNARRGRR